MNDACRRLPRPADASALARCVRGMAAGLLLLVGGCGGGGPSAPAPAPRVEMSGTATGGATSGPDEFAGEFAAKGAAGILRTANAAAGSLDYRISLAELAAPYALRAVLGDAQRQVTVYAVAAEPGTANLTPLTTLLVAQLYGEDPETVYDRFGDGIAAPAGGLAAERIAEAQQAVEAYLGETLDLAVPAAAGSFLTTPFTAAAGDPMYDTVRALEAALARQGSTFAQLTADVALAARECLAERLVVTIGGSAADFCPRTKSATPRPDDPDRIAHRIVDRRGATLVLDVDGDVLLSARFVTGAGTAYRCSGSGCSGITLGPPQADGVRTLAFDGARLAGPGGSARLDGSVLGAEPGVVLPVLPCETNRFIVVGDDRSVVGRCADPDPFGFGVGGVPGALLGVEVSRGMYDFTAPFGTDPTAATVSVITDGYDGVLAVQFTDRAPGGSAPRRRFLCTFSGCTGISRGPLTIDTDFGGPDFPFYLRTFTFAGTRLDGVDAEGAPTGEAVTLDAVLATAYLLPIPPLRYPATTSCGSGRQALAARAGTAAFVACLPPGRIVAGDGTIELRASSVFETDDQLSIVAAADGTVREATLRLSAVPGDFRCTGGCPGITVGAPEADGARSVEFSAAALAERFFGAAGPRQVRLGAGTLRFAR